MSGGWLGDPESTPCEMGGGPLVDYERALHPVNGFGSTRSRVRSAKTDSDAVRLALKIASGTKVTFLCATEAQKVGMMRRVERLLLDAGVFPVKKYMKRLTVQHSVGK
jgi:hypothetical protein